MKKNERPLLAVLVLALAAGCASTPEVAAEPEWVEPAPSLAKLIEDQVKRLPWTHGEARIELIHWFASVGEPAYPRLLVLCTDPRPEVASSAVAALGATGDSRLVEPLHGLDWPQSLYPQVRYERARAFMRLGDWSQVGDLIDGLEEDSVWTRAWCAQALAETTGQRFNYDPRASEPERHAATQRWRGWMRSRYDEGILASVTLD